MHVRFLRCLPGPSVWASRPVLEVALEQNDKPDSSPEHVRRTLECLQAGFPGPEPEASAGGRDSLLGLARAFGGVALRLQELAGTPVSFAGARQTPHPGVVLAAVEFAEETVGRAALEAAGRLLQAAQEGRPLSVDEELPRLRDLAYDRRLPVTTRVVYDAARARGIPAARLNPEYARFLRLGHGAKQHRFRACEPDTASAVARMVSTDKHLAKQLLRAQGVPVPRGRLVSTAEEAWAAACELGLPVVVKPVDCDLAIGVSLDLRSREQVEAGFRGAREHSDEVLVEHFAPGIEHRVLVVADQVVAVARIDPPHVVGDGKSTVAELVDRVNRDARRGDEGSHGPLYKIKMDDVARDVLTVQGFTTESVPPPGARVLLRRNPPYLMNGGCLIDLTDHIHPSTAAHAVAAARAVQLPVAGLDAVVGDIGRPLEEQEGVIVEINTSPGLWLHVAPYADSPRPVGEAIVAALFPPGEDGRIPVAALVGQATAGTTRHLSALLTAAGRCVGSAGPAGVVVAGRHWVAQVNTPQGRADILMENTSVDVALLETSPEELVAAGFGTDRCDVALVVPAEVGSAGPVATVAPARVLLLGGESGSHAESHLAAGGRALGFEGGVLVLRQGTAAPLALGKASRGRTEQETAELLPALAAGLLLGTPVEAVRTYFGGLT